LGASRPSGNRTAVGFSQPGDTGHLETQPVCRSADDPMRAVRYRVANRRRSWSNFDACPLATTERPTNPQLAPRSGARSMGGPSPHARGGDRREVYLIG
jgi:hypothetical protein